MDPRPRLVGELAETFAHYPRIGPLLPAMGYGAQHVPDLEATLRAGALPPRPWAHRGRIPRRAS